MPGQHLLATERWGRMASSRVAEEAWCSLEVREWHSAKRCSSACRCALKFWATRAGRAPAWWACKRIQVAMAAAHEERIMGMTVCASHQPVHIWRQQLLVVSHAKGGPSQDISK